MGTSQDADAEGAAAEPWPVRAVSAAIGQCVVLQSSQAGLRVLHAESSPPWAGSDRHLGAGRHPL